VGEIKVGFLWEYSDAECDDVFWVEGAFLWVWFWGWCVGEIAIEITRKTGVLNGFNTPYIAKLKHHKIIVL